MEAFSKKIYTLHCALRRVRAQKNPLADDAASQQI